jgi:hypothetical protein
MEKREKLFPKTVREAFYLNIAQKEPEKRQIE